MKIRVYLFWSLLFFIFFCSSPSPDPETVTLISNIKADLPDGWECTVITDIGDRFRPSGLKNPVFRLDFSNLDISTADNRQGNHDNPSIQLYIYYLKYKPEIMEAIKRSVFSSSGTTAIYFGETDEYIVVTSLFSISYGVYSEKAKSELWDSLRKHIESKEDSTFDRLFRSSK